MDCLDPAFAPGVSHYEPGGLSTREVLTLIQNLKGNLIGADIVEFNPDRDPSGITGMVAAKLLKEILGRMLADNTFSLIAAIAYTHNLVLVTRNVIDFKASNLPINNPWKGD